MSTLVINIGGTGPKRRLQIFEFQWRAMRALLQARSAPGNRHAATRFKDGIYFSLTAWESREAMLAYSRSGAHGAALRVSRRLLKPDWFFHQFEADKVPDWNEALTRWQTARSVASSTLEPATP